MINKNYYIAYYQAIIEKNLANVTQLYLLSNKEQEEYLKEHPSLNYDNVFQDNDPENIIKSLWKDDEYKDFHSALLDKIKTLAGNYYVAFYVALIELNAIKIAKVLSLTAKEKINHPNQYPLLHYNNIFQDNDPDDALLIIYNSNKELGSVVNDALNPLVTEATLAERKANYLELMRYPLLDYCSNPDHGFNILKNLASVSYSTIFNRNTFATTFTMAINTSPILAELFSTVATSTNVATDKPLSIALLGNNIQEYDPTINKYVTAKYRDVKNLLIVTNRDKKIDLPIFSHEFTHVAMHLLFNNSIGYPYNNNSSEMEIKYHQAIKNTLLNIKRFIQDDFGLEINIKEADSTWQIGEKLSSILYPIVRQDNNIMNFISFLKEHNLDINAEFTWLSGHSILFEALLFQNFEIADQLVKNGAIINSEIVHFFAPYDNMKILDWVLSNDQAVNINFKDRYGRTALEYARNFQTVKKLIDAGAEVYSANYYEKICSINPNYKEPLQLSVTIIEQLKALQPFLILYNQYKSSEEDSEFIARLPQIIAAGLYKGKVVDIIEPIVKYWQEEISSAMLKYQNDLDQSDVCLPLICSENYYEII